MIRRAGSPTRILSRNGAISASTYRADPPQRYSANYPEYRARRGIVRRAKLFYLQNRVGSKATRIKEKK